MELELPVPLRLCRTVGIGGSEKNMTHPLQIDFHNGHRQEDVETRVRQERAELEKFYHRIVSCRVEVQLPEHPRRGSLCKVLLELRVPSEDATTPAALRGGQISGDGTELVVIEAEHKDPSLAVHEAFTTARRRLEEFTGR